MKNKILIALFMLVTLFAPGLSERINADDFDGLKKVPVKDVLTKVRMFYDIEVEHSAINYVFGSKEYCVCTFGTISDFKTNPYNSAKCGPYRVIGNSIIVKDFNNNEITLVYKGVGKCTRIDAAGFAHHMIGPYLTHGADRKIVGKKLSSTEMNDKFIEQVKQIIQE